MRLLRLAVAGVLVGSFVMAAGPASAGSTCVGDATTAPDGKVGVDGDAFVGGGAFPKTAISTAVSHGARVRFVFTWKNLRDTNQRIKIASYFGQNAGTRTRWFVDGEKATDAFITNSASAWVFRGVAPGRRVTVEVVIKNQGGDASTWVAMQGRYAGEAFTACDDLAAAINGVSPH